MTTRVKAMVFAAMLAGHWSLQFLSWADAIRSAEMHMVWSVLSAPLFYVLPGLVVQDDFWVVATVNSVLWALPLTYIAGRFWATVAANRGALGR